jgi:putative hemolysin
MSGTAGPLFLILLMVAANALYVAAEFATVGSRRSRVQEAAEEGNRRAQALLAILRDPRRLDNYVAGCQVGITLSSLVAGAFGQSRLTPLLEPYLGALGGATAAIVIVLVLITILQVVLGELLPKTVALRYPERLAMACLLPMQVSLLLFKPLIALFNGTAFALMRRLGLHTEHSHTHVHSPEELEGLYRESAAGGLIDASERDMLAGALNVDDKLVREIMTPRTRMLTIRGDDSVCEALRRAADSPYSRFPVVGADRDDVTGIVHLRELFAESERDPGASVASIQREPLVVADVMPVPALWKALRTAGRHSAIVVNEYGSVAGMVTLEDALEEIFGELQDEFDSEEEQIIEHDHGFSVRGDVGIAVLNDRFALGLPEADVDTIGGLVWHELGRLPEAGDEVAVAGTPHRLRVESMDR